MGLEPGKTHTTKMGDPVVKEEGGWWDDDGNYGAGEAAQEKAERSCEAIMDEMGHIIRQLRHEIIRIQLQRNAYREALLNLEKEKNNG